MPRDGRMEGLKDGRKDGQTLFHTTFPGTTGGPILILFALFNKLSKKNNFKGNVQFVQKVIFEPLMDLKKNHYESWKYYKGCYF